MRTLINAGLLLSIAAVPVAADAQRAANAPVQTMQGGWSQGRSGNWNAPRSGQQNQARAPRWGNRVNGQWYAGVHAPGGWNAYRRPARGWTLPRYWVAPSFYIGDYETYGLATPPSGYTWSRYYDDAVLVDQRGQVWDSVNGVEWDRYDGGYADGRYANDPYYGDGYATGQSDHYAGQPQYRDRRDSGVGGAVIGGVVGGVAGNVIAGRGNRTAGTLIGAGVGAATGYAIDRSEDRRRYDAPPPPPPGYYEHRQPGVSYAPPREVVQSGYASSSYSSGYQQGGYISGGYWYPPTTQTIVTVGSAPVTTTTTTTEYVETRYVAPRRVWKAKKVAWKPRPKVRSCTCVCQMVCR